MILFKLIKMILKICSLSVNDRDRVCRPGQRHYVLKVAVTKANEWATPLSYSYRLARDTRHLACKVGQIKVSQISVSTPSSAYRDDSQLHFVAPYWRRVFSDARNDFLIKDSGVSPDHAFTSRNWHYYYLRALFQAFGNVYFNLWPQKKKIKWVIAYCDVNFFDMFSSFFVS